MATKAKPQRAACPAKVQDGLLYVDEGDGWRVVTVGGMDKPYRDAYRRLFGRMGMWPPDGAYRFTGSKLRAAKP